MKILEYMTFSNHGLSTERSARELVELSQDCFGKNDVLANSLNSKPIVLALIPSTSFPVKHSWNAVSYGNDVKSKSLVSVAA